MKKIQNNLSSSNYKLFKEKAKTSLYLKNNPNSNNNDNIDLLMSKNQTISKHNSNIFHFKGNHIYPKTNRNKDTSNENKKISLFKNNNYLNNIKNINAIKANNNKLYILKSNIVNHSDKKSSGFSNRGNNSLLYSSGPKVKRPTSCMNKKHEKIIYNAKNNKTIKFANQGKKIYLKTNNKTNINIENINNVNINLNDKLNNSNDEIDDKNSNNQNVINLTKQMSPAIYPHTILSPSGNIITDIFFVRNLGDQSLKTTKASIKFNNFYDDKDEKQKRFSSSINNKLIKDNSNNILL